jgi:sugar O-acyltransferase (sialic acid O-acetyltransferase NeuD family)
MKKKTARKSSKRAARKTSSRKPQAKVATASAQRVLVYGASGHGKVVADAALAAGLEVVGFCDDDPARRGLVLLGREVLAIGVDEVVALCKRDHLALALGVGSNRARMKLFEAIEASGLEVVTVIHPAAVIAPYVMVKKGAVVFAGVVVNPDSTIEEGAILNTSCSVDHDNHIGRFAHLSPGVHLGGTVNVGEGTHVGIGASVRNNLTIGEWCMIGAGSAVVKDVPDGALVAGVPARSMKS